MDRFRFTCAGRGWMNPSSTPAHGNGKLRRTNPSALLLAFAVLPVFSFAGCGDSAKTARPAAGVPPSSSTGQKPEEPLNAPEEQHAAGTGITIKWQEKTESGGIRIVLDVKAETGALDAVTQSGALKQAAGRFFRAGKPRARFTAPEVVATRDKQIVVARGGVTVNSIDPPGVALRAEQITWYAERHQIVARGGVKLSHTPKGAAGPVAYGNVPQATANTELQVITVP